MQSSKRFGLSCALTLPVRLDATIDFARLVAHAQRLLDTGCSGVTVFGTTGEGASVSLREREQTLEALSQAGIPLRNAVIGGVAATATGDAADQARMLYDHDCRGVLLAPPFYFKNVTDEGLYRWFSEVFKQLGTAARDVFLYNIPSVTNVALSIGLIERLKSAYPDVIVGVKDSGGAWNYTEELLQTHADLILLIGDERHLAHGVRLGAAGAISGLANVISQRLLTLIETGHDDGQMSEFVNELLKFPVTPAVKVLVADDQQDSAWRNVRPPLVSLSQTDATQLTQHFHRLIHLQKAAH